MAYQLPALPYEFNSLEPHIDAKTMEIHYTKHHQGYVNKVNAALEGTEFAEKAIEDVLRSFNTLPEDKKSAVRNNGGGHANHSLFWSILAPAGSSEYTGSIADAFNETFGSLEKFKEMFAAAATGQFGSGWAWVVVKDGELSIESTPNQDSPLMEGKTPILGLDVWEHAYYLNYQNRRPDYVSAFFEIINWQEVEKNFQNA